MFVQVFYQAAGYFGKTPYIARFERDLVKHEFCSQRD